jgi:hypothetical protein
MRRRRRIRTLVGMVWREGWGIKGPPGPAFAISCYFLSNLSENRHVKTSASFCARFSLINGFILAKSRIYPAQILVRMGTTFLFFSISGLCIPEHLVVQVDVLLCRLPLERGTTPGHLGGTGFEIGCRCEAACHQPARQSIDRLERRDKEKLERGQS